MSGSKFARHSVIEDSVPAAGPVNSARVRRIQSSGCHNADARLAITPTRPRCPGKKYVYMVIYSGDAVLLDTGNLMKAS